jgi:hypothetical protein
MMKIVSVKELLWLDNFVDVLKALKFCYLKGAHSFVLPRVGLPDPRSRIFTPSIWSNWDYRRALHDWIKDSL